jgi:hypothetical protein
MPARKYNYSSDEKLDRELAREWCRSYKLDPNTRQPDPSLHLFILLQQCRLVTVLDNVSEATLLALVQIHAPGIKYIKNPSKELQIACVTKQPSAIGAIENPCLEARLISIQGAGTSLRYFSEHTPELEQMAVSQSAFAISHVKNPSPALMQQAVSAAPTAIRYLDNPSVEAQKIALSGTEDSIVVEDADLELLAKYPDKFSAEVIDLIRPGLSIVLHFSDAGSYADRLSVMHSFLSAADDVPLELPLNDATCSRYAP